MITRVLLLILLIGFSTSSPLMASAKEVQVKINTISTRLLSTEIPTERAKLYCYRGRNYAKLGDNEKAKDDYLNALNSSYEGWILNELAYFMYRIGQYEKAYNVSARVLNDFPHLKKEATKLKNQAKKKWDEEYLKNNPPTITIDTAPDPNRVTRHDLNNQTKTRQGINNSSKKGTSSSGKPISEHWGKHPATKNIPVPQQRDYDY